MPTPDRFLSALREKLFKFREEALNPGLKDQTEFGYGKACGIAQGLALAEELYDDQTAKEERENESKLAGTPRR